MTGVRVHLPLYADWWTLISGFTARANLNYHLQCVHSEGRNVICQECGDNFKSMRTLKNHHIRAHGAGEKQHTCEICGKSFFKNNELVSHSRIHSGQKPYNCSFCGLAFRDRSCVRRHEDIIHKGVIRHQCHKCGKGYAEKCKYRLHVNKCKGGKPRVETAVEFGSHFGSHLKNDEPK